MLRKQILLSGNKECFCLKSKTFFASQTQMLLSKHMFPSLANMKKMLTRFQCCSLKCFQIIPKMVFMLPFALQFKDFFNVFAFPYVKIKSKEICEEIEFFFFFLRKMLMSFFEIQANLLVKMRGYSIFLFQF